MAAERDTGRAQDEIADERAERLRAATLSMRPPATIRPATHHRGHSVPLAERLSLKLAWSTWLTSRSGANFDTVGLTLQYRWFDG
jgi:hypothetical protein